MTLIEYFSNMENLGYPHPSIRFWLDENDKMTGSASYMGTCGHGGYTDFIPQSWEHLTAHLFDCVTNGRKEFAS